MNSSDTLHHPAGIIPSRGVSDAAADPPRAKKKRSLTRLFAVGAVMAVAGVVTWSLRPAKVTATPVVRGVAVDAVYATGTVEAFDRVAVKAKVSGTIADLKVREGDHVKKGDLIAVIDAPSVKFDLERGRAELWTARRQAGADAPQLAALEAQALMTSADLTTARQDRDRLKRLFAEAAIPAADLDRATNRVAALEAQLASQVAQAKALKIDLAGRAMGSSAAVGALQSRVDDTEVRAPMEGVVLSRSIDPGQVVGVNETLVHIGDTRRLVVECSVDEADVGKIRVGQHAAVSLHAFAGQAFDGEVLQILPDTDRIKKSFPVKIQFDDPPEGLQSGMNAEVNVISGRHEAALLAPADAIDANGEAWVVRDGHAEKRALKTGVRDLLRAEILGGVDEGDQLVVSGAETLTPGSRVRATLRALDANTPMPQGAKQGATL